MPVPAQLALLPFLTLESLLLGGVSVVPSALPLAAFCAWALQISELSDAPVRQVLCNRQGVHEFILLSCDITTVARDVVTLWFRIERRPKGQGVGVLLNKPKPAVDTIQASTNLQALREPCESRDSFLYNPHENPRVVLKFKHIAEMCRYFTGHSCEYSLLGANCRWICYALLECLRESQPCYGGTWLPSRTERPTADVRAAQLAKSHYLQDKHSACCGRQYLNYPNLGAQITGVGVGLASVAVANPGQGIHSRDSQYEQDVIYRTPGSSSTAAAPRLESSILATNANGKFGSSGAPQVLSASGASSNNTASSNTAGTPSEASTTQPNRNQHDVSPLPAGANIAQYPQSSPVSLSEDMLSDSQRQQHTKLPVQHTVSQPGGGVISSHCSGCQCAIHTGHQGASHDPRLRSTPLQSPPANSRGDDAFDLVSQLSSMSLRSDASIPESSRGQWIGENVSVPTESNTTSSTHRCSNCDSFGSPCPADSRRIHPNSFRQSVMSTTSAGPRQHGNPAPMAQHPSCHGRCSSHVGLTNNPPVAHDPCTQRISEGSNIPHVPQQRLSQFSFSSLAPSVAGVAAGCTVHHNRTPSLGTDYSNYDPQASVHTQGCHHAHNRPLPGPSLGSLCSASRGYSSPHVNGSPRPCQAHETAPLQTICQSARGSSHACATMTQSRSSTGTSYLASGDYTNGPSPPFPRNSVNRNGLYQFQAALHDHTYVPPSPVRQSGNIEEQYYHPTQPNRWGLTNEPMTVDQSSGYGTQAMLPNHAHPLSSSNFHAQVTSDYPYAQDLDTTPPQPYVPSGLPADPYPRPGLSNRQWTQEVWGGQEFGLPMRTDSPIQIESPSTNDVYASSQAPPSMPVPDPYNCL